MPRFATGLQMSWLMNVPPIASARRKLEARADAVWRRDRAALHGPASFGNRAFRIGIHTVRGVVAHRLGLHASALTYYTVFAIVPVLVVALWILRSFDRLPAFSSGLPAGAPAATGDQVLHAARGMIFAAVDQTSEIVTAILGLAALLFAVSRMFAFTERALQVIAGSGQRTPKLSRVLAYVALLLIPPVGLAISGAVLALVRGWHAHPVSRVLPTIAGVEVALGIGIGFGALWLAVTLLYTAAARARIPFASAAVGGALAAVALPAISWVFVSFQIGVTHASAVGSGVLAVPVFLLWAFSSWYAILMGAEIAVAHRVDRVLVHGAATFRLDGLGERRAGVAIMLQLTRMSAGAPGTQVTEDELARALRLPPAIVRALCFRLVQRGLLAEDVHGFRLRGDPERMTFDTVADAIDRDPALDRFDVSLPAPQRLN